MAYMGQTLGARVTNDNGGNAGQAPCEALVVVVEDQARLFEVFQSVCDCLDVAIERISSRDELGAVLRERRPMAIVAEMEGAGQDGCHVLMTVAKHDRGLPVLLVTGGDAALLGAIDAVEELWQLTSVVKWPSVPGIGSVVDFLFRAGRRGGCMRLMSV